MDHTFHRKVSVAVGVQPLASFPDMYQRPYPTVRSGSTTPIPEGFSSQRVTSRPSPRLSPLLPSAALDTQRLQLPTEGINLGGSGYEPAPEPVPSICGMPLKYVSCVTFVHESCRLSCSFLNRSQFLDWSRSRFKMPRCPL